VFVIGVALIATSIALFVSGKLTTAQAVGSGTAFTGGLVATLLTVYSGPLKDIRQSVSDLGAANVAFIGFIHQVLQVSHTWVFELNRAQYAIRLRCVIDRGTRWQPARNLAAGDSRPGRWRRRRVGAAGMGARARRS
jgi:hypothetical protein